MKTYLDLNCNKTKYPDILIDFQWVNFVLI